MLYAVIMAGGQGTRLWPMSRKAMPKQLQKLASESSLIQETVERLMGVMGPDKIYISTTPEYAEAMREQLPKVPKENFVLEPSARGNAAACGLVSTVLQKRDKEAAALFLPADHAIKDIKRFQEIIQYAGELIQKHPKHIITIGIEPNRPDTGLGYIQMGEELDYREENSLRAYQVQRFVEKPDLKTAEEYISSSQYLWNSGSFLWRTDHFLDLMQKNMADTYGRLQKIGDALGTTEYEKVLQEQYGEVENTTIDYGIMEKTNDIIVVPGDFGWSDIGSWSTLYELLSEVQDSKVVSRGHHISVDDVDSLVFSGEKLVATIGLKDIIVVDTPDALLICDRHKAPMVKDLLKKLKEEGKEEYL